MADMLEAKDTRYFQPLYFPDSTRFAERQPRRAQSHSARNSALQKHLPAKIDSALSWQGSALKQSDYVIHLSNEHMQDIDRACSEYSGHLQTLKQVVYADKV